MKASQLSRRRGVLRVIALLVLLAAPSLAQDGGSDPRPSGQCMPSREPHECAERCPSFDTCFVATGDGQLYYEVGDQRFGCAGLECSAANQLLADYCCRRGELAPPPSQGGDEEGGGCSLTFSGGASSGGASSNGGMGMIGGLWAGLLGLALRRRRSGEQRSPQ